MNFRPCIDIHNGQVKQIIGGSLADVGDQAIENFVAAQDAAWFANLYKKDKLKGGHIILLNGQDSKYYEETKIQAQKALKAYPGGLQLGGGIDGSNAADFLRMGASHVIVTSYIFKDGLFYKDHLLALESAIGRDKIVLDLSCRKKDGHYYIVTNRWQTFTNQKLDEAFMWSLSNHCDEFLIHGVDVEGKSAGMDRELVSFLKEFDKRPITYAGGIGSLEDLSEFASLSQGKLDFTIGSALDIFGGKIPYKILI